MKSIEKFKTLFTNPSFRFFETLINTAIIFLLIVILYIIGLKNIDNLVVLHFLVLTYPYVGTLFYLIALTCAIVTIGKFRKSKSKISLSELGYGFHEILFSSFVFYESISIHLDKKRGLNVIKDKRSLNSGFYFVSQAIESIEGAFELILTNNKFSSIELIYGESIHVKKYIRTFKKLGIKVYPLNSIIYSILNFVLMWTYNIRINRNYIPSFKALFKRIYCFEVPVSWLKDTENYKKLKYLKSKF